MTSGSSEHFPKRVRLRRRLEYLEVQRKGRKVDGRAFLCLFLEKEAGPTRLGITTPKRIGPAVLRNRARRLVRESFRRGRMRLPDRVDVVFIAKHRAASLDTQSIFEDLAGVGEKVRRLLEQDY